MQQQFHAEFVITEACNLDCPYCYMTHKNTYMSLDVFKEHLELLPKIMKEYNAETYQASIFGGEPLLNFELIKEILSILTSDHKCRSIVMPTNGLLLNQEKRNFLEQHKVGVSWSFDGLWHHNHADLPKFKEIRKLLPKNSCKAMISPYRKYTLKENYVWFINEFNMLSPDFSIVRDNIWTQQEVAIYKDEIRELADDVIAFNRLKVFSLPSPFSLYILDTIVGKKYGKRGFGCFSGCHGAAFMPSGDVYPCGRYGSAEKHPLYIGGQKVPVNIERYKDPNNVNPCVFDMCKTCELFFYCNAGCTYSQELNGFKPISEVCELFKATYDQAFRIVHELKDDMKFKTSLRNMLKEKQLCL